MALCAKCKNQIEVGDSFCRHCGRMLNKSPVRGHVSVSKHREKPLDTQETSTLAILALVLAFVIPIAGFILSFFALAQFKKHPNLKGKGLAWAAFLLPLVATLVFLLIFLIRTFSG